MNPYRREWSDRERELLGRMQRVIDHVPLTDCAPFGVSLPLLPSICAAVSGRWIGRVREQVDSFDRCDFPFRGLRACQRIMRRLEQHVAEAIR